MIFIDTTMWVSAIDASDELHEDGKAVLGKLVEGNLPLTVTTDFVLDETLTMLKKRGAKPSKVAEDVQNIVSSMRVNIVYVDEMLFKESLYNYTKYATLSFTDAVSLTVMLRLKIGEVYSHDKDFDLKGIIRKESP